MRRILLLLVWLPMVGLAQFNTDRLVMIGRSALYYEDYVLSMQYFNQVILAKPYLYEPWYFRAIAKYCLDDYAGAESDCTEAITRNPFVVGIYELRGLCRIQQKHYDEAISDYNWPEEIPGLSVHDSRMRRFHDCLDVAIEARRTPCRL